MNTGGRRMTGLRHNLPVLSLVINVPLMPIYMANSMMFPANSSLPQAGTVATKLRDRKYKGTRYPKEVILDRNPTAYAKEAQMQFILVEQPIGLEPHQLW